MRYAVMAGHPTQDTAVVGVYEKSEAESVAIKNNQAVARGVAGWCYFTKPVTTVGRSWPTAWAQWKKERGK